MKNKLLSIILIAIMVLAIVPSMSFANSSDPYEEDIFGDPITTTVTTKPSNTVKPTPTQASSTSPTTNVVKPTNTQNSTSAQSNLPSESKTNSVDPTSPDDTNQTNPTVGPTDPTSNSTDSNNQTEHTHNFIAKITKTPSCTEEGIKSFSCKCGYSYTESILKTNHKTMFKVVDSTYFKQGTKSKVCTFCGLKISQVSLDKKVVNKSFFTLQKGKKQFKINYKRVGKSIGFQVRYRIKGKWKTKTFNTKKNATKTIKNLKKGTYTVQIRAFRKISGNVVYSRWTSSRKVKVTNK